MFASVRPDGGSIFGFTLPAYDAGEDEALPEIVAAPETTRRPISRSAALT
jgi:hypothetical protein